MRYIHHVYVDCHDDVEDEEEDYAADAADAAAAAAAANDDDDDDDDDEDDDDDDDDDEQYYDLDGHSWYRYDDYVPVDAPCRDYDDYQSCYCCRNAANLIWLAGFCAGPSGVQPNPSQCTSPPQSNPRHVRNDLAELGIGATGTE